MKDGYRTTLASDLVELFAFYGSDWFVVIKYWMDDLPVDAHVGCGVLALGIHISYGSVKTVKAITSVKVFAMMMRQKYMCKLWFLS